MEHDTQRRENGGQLRTFHLFAGAGGGILADILLGHVPVGACEIEEYPRRVLLQRQRDGILPTFPIWDDICTLDGKPWRGLVDVVAGGFPCQDISSAGGGAGISGERSGLWKEMARIIDEIRPRYAFLENSPMLTSRGLGVVLGDLAAMGYNARWGVLGACDIGAPHKRERIWIVADTESFGHGESREAGDVPEKNGGQDREMRAESSRSSQRPKNMADPSELQRDVSKDNSGGGAQRKPIPESGDNRRAQNMANASSFGQPRQREPWYAIDPAEEEDWEAANAGDGCIGGIWGIESPMGRVANGLADNMDRLKAIGNGQVPSVAALAWQILTNTKEAIA